MLRLCPAVERCDQQARRAQANLDAPISVLPSCCDASNPPRYPTVVSRDYTAAKIAKHGN